VSAYLRALSLVAPAYAMRIAQAQIALRGYDGAQQGRRTSSFRRDLGSANAEISNALPILRARSRELTRNTFIGERVLSILSTHIVSPDLTIRITGRSATATKNAQALWNEWMQSCDIEGETGLTGLLEVAIRSSLEGGDSIIRMIDRPLNNDRPVPLALFVGEGDLIDHTRDAALQLANQNGRARLGVQLGDFDERLGYWLFATPPGEPTTTLTQPTSALVPRGDVCHLFRRKRAGQVRGVPVFAPVLMASRDYGDLMDALIVKSRLEASIGLIVKGGRPIGNLAQAADAAGNQNRIESLRPGMVNYLNEGEDVTAFAPAGNTAFEPVSRACLLGIAAGAGLTYHQLTGDLTQANYSSLRAGLIEFRREIASWQWNTLVPQTLARIVDRFIARALLAGRLRGSRADYRVEYVMPANEPVDPKKDLEADILAVRAGRMSPQDFIGAWGRDWREVVDEYAEFMGLIDAKNLALDIDARNRTRTGQAVTEPTTSTEDANA
jgi:lambda family phage portal protein